MLERIFKFIVRLVLLGAGLAFALLMFALALLGLLFWSLRAFWARITGRPVEPLVFTVLRKAQWERFYRQNKSTAQSAAEVVDVEAKTVDEPPPRRIER